MNRAKLLVLPTVVGLIVPVLAGCGGGSGGEDGGGQDPIVMGSTDTIGSLDPAGAYDIGTWTLFTNSFQTLMRYPRDGSVPKPDAAEKCEFTDQDSQAYRCTLKSGLTFSNGNPLTADDVKFSIDRSIRIADDFGPSSLFDNVDKVETSGDETVVFHLKSSDATFPFVLATPAAAIVDQDTYPAESLLKDKKIVGSGPYTLDSFEDGVKAEFSKNAKYRGSADVQMKNSRFEVRYFKDSTQMQRALEKSEIDLTHRTLTPKQIVDLEGQTDQGIKLIEAPGTEIRYLVFNTNNPTVKNPAVRKAMAQLVDRKALVRDVYERTAEPLNSMIPKNITGHVNSFFNEYGEPSLDKARGTLTKAGISTPVALTLWYTSDHYGSATIDEFEELKRQLEQGGLFKVTLKSRKWKAYQAGYQKHQYAVFGMGWFPDFPDPDNYIAPFMAKNNFLKTPYSSDTIVNQLLPRSRQQSERGAVVDEFTRAQDIIASDVPLLPLWQGKQYVATRDTISGVEWTLDASSTFRFWELSKGAGG